MNKWKKAILIFGFTILFYILSYGLFTTFTKNEKILEEIISILLILSLLLSLFVVHKIKNKIESTVIECSEKIKLINELNLKYEFKEITCKNYKIVEREYSRKSLDRVNGDDVIKYYIENNKRDLRTNIENSIFNVSLLDSYEKEVQNILNKPFKNKTKYSDKKYKAIENTVLKRLIHTKKDFVINVHLEVYYRSNGGNVFDNRLGYRKYEELLNLYKEWENGNKYEITKREERKIMNDDIRYNVLKRDNFTCQKCGASNKDGAKLEVDHIIPVAKGGKTIMSNLQTLCDRCNNGKSDKVADDFKNINFCPKCGGTLVKRNGKYGLFIGCSNYPKCKYVKK